MQDVGRPNRSVVTRNDFSIRTQYHYIMDYRHISNPYTIYDIALLDNR